MRTSRLCNNNRNHIRRCHVPLIEICDSTSQIKLDLGSCGGCSTTPAALLLRKGGCTEWETVCEPPRSSPCCGVVDARPTYWGSKRAVEKPKPSIIYPLHEIDPQGMSVFVLDGKLRELGYGRYHAVVLLADNGTLPADRPVQETDYRATEIVFDIDYVEYKLGLGAIATESLQPNLGEC